MTTCTIKGNELISALAGEIVKRKDNLWFTTQKLPSQNQEESEPVKIKNYNTFKVFIINVKILIVNFIQIYKFIINFIDKYFSILLLLLLEKLSAIFLVIRWLLEKYIRKKKYDDLWQFNKTLDDIDVK